MDFSDWLFWNVDTQKDFIETDGRLCVSGADKLKPNWKILTTFAKKNSIRVVNTADYHNYNSPEIDTNPDYIKTFPVHCIAGSEGAEFIKETNPEEPVIFDWNKEYLFIPEIIDEKKHRNFIIRKDAFDVFSGNPWTKKIVQMLKPETVVVYGVTTNVCVDYAVKGLSSRVKNIIVIKDAVKELPKIMLPFKNWKKKGVRILTLEEFMKQVN